MKDSALFALNPLVPLALCLMTGIAIGHNYDINLWGLVSLMLLLAVAALLLFAQRRACTMALLLLTTVTGITLISLYERDMEVELPKGWTELETIVADEPVDRGRTLRLDLIITSGELTGRSIRVSLQKDTVSNRHEGIAVGDGLRIFTKLRKPENFRAGNFDYATYLKLHGMVAQAYIRSDLWQRVAANTDNISLTDRTRMAALSLRHKITSRYRSLGLSGQAFAVVAAMTFGDKTSLSQETRDVYAAVGTSHILALSGMHLGIIYSLLSLLSLGRRLRAMRELLLVTSIWIYVFMVGLSPSVVRSAVMLTVYSFICLTGRRRMSLSALSFTAIVMLAANPLCLYDIGFELSFLSVAFILIYNSRLSCLVSNEYQQNHPIVRFFWQMACMSIVAQIGTAPLVTYYFGRQSVYFLLANFIVIPAATVILYAAVALLFLSVLPSVQSLVAVFLQFFVSLINALLLFIAHLPGATVDNIHLNDLQVALLYVITFILLHLMTLYVRRKTEEA